jgi:hypothetical protein
VKRLSGASHETTTSTAEQQRQQQHQQHQQHATCNMRHAMGSAEWARGPLDETRRPPAKTPTARSRRTEATMRNQMPKCPRPQGPKGQGQVQRHGASVACAEEAAGHGSKRGRAGGVGPALRYGWRDRDPGMTTFQQAYRSCPPSAPLTHNPAAASRFRFCRSFPSHSRPPRLASPLPFHLSTRPRLPLPIAASAPSTCLPSPSSLPTWPCSTPCCPSPHSHKP